MVTTHKLKTACFLATGVLLLLVIIKYTPGNHVTQKENPPRVYHQDENIQLWMNELMSSADKMNAQSIESLQKDGSSPELMNRSFDNKVQMQNSNSGEALHTYSYTHCY